MAAPGEGVETSALHAEPHLGAAGLAAVLALSPDVAARLAAEHVDRGDGRCRVCSLGNQAGHHRWPCTLHAAAVQAIGMVGHAPDMPP